MSLVKQTYRPFEVVVVNGPSNDGTAQMLERFSNRIRIATCPVARLGQSRNIGVDQAAGDIVAFTDDDAIPESDWLERIVGPFDDPHVSAVGGPVFDVPLDRIEWKICTCTRLGEARTDSPPPIDTYNRPGSDPFPYLAGCNMSFRRSALLQIGGFNSLLSWVYDDVDVCVTLNDSGHAIRYCEEALVRHDRASSAVRDERQRITDPYALIYSRIVFALQCSQREYKINDIDRHIDEWESGWVAHAEGLLAQRVISSGDRDAFAARAAKAAADGRAAGHDPRPFTSIGPPLRARFRPFV
jgi:glycosyltransferase involved in cell wall biosynthesis